MDLQRARQLLATHDQELVELVERLDRESAPYQGESRRADPRLPYRAGVLVIMIIDSEDSRNYTVAFPRNLSPGGVSLVKRGYTFPGWKIHVALRRSKGDPLIARGVIRSCRHLTGPLHEIGIQFDERIDPSLVCESGVGSATPSETPPPAEPTATKDAAGSDDAAAA